jgi:hypothetical protein
MRLKNTLSAAKQERSCLGQGADDTLARSAASTADESDEVIEHKALDSHPDLWGIEIQTANIASTKGLPALARLIERN